MPRFGVAFNRRKSTAVADELQKAHVAPEHPSFRVIEHSDVAAGKTFDGGVRLARASAAPLPRNNMDSGVDDNMFVDHKANRGSGASNTTKGTYTDASSRHSNASTAPSSTDVPHDDWRHQNQNQNHHQTPYNKKNLPEAPYKNSPKSSGSSFLNRAGRTFSFGQKKNSSSPPKDDIPDVPPVPAFQYDDNAHRTRGMTGSTSSTITSPKLDNNNNGMDMGGDFGSMFSAFDKRASVQALKNEGSAAPRSLTGNHALQPAPLTIDKTSRVEAPLESYDSHKDQAREDDSLLASGPPSPVDEPPPPVPRHQSSFKASGRPSDILEDEDAKLLQDSLAVGRLLAESEPEPAESSSNRGWGQDNSYTSFARKSMNSSFRKGDDNIFEGTNAQTSRFVSRQPQQPTKPANNKVMTPAEFERYRKDVAWEEAQRKLKAEEQDDEDEINYDDDDDDAEKSKQQAKQRRKQEAHMAVYRQQMMKVTGEQPDANPPDRSSIAMSMSAPQLSLMKGPSPGPADEGDDDDEVPLAILQAHGFPNRNRPPTRLTVMGSNPNLRASVQFQPPPRPGSAMADASAQPGANTQRHSTLPAFARGLPQDPFVGASIARPALRESLTFSGGIPASQSQQSLPHGGLVGVIANEERSRAMRRGSPNVESQRLMGMNGPQGGGFDPMTGVPPHMMYGMGGPGGMPGMPQQMPQHQPSLSVGDQAQLQMTQQMGQFMQMQMQFMQMMAGNNQNGAPPQQPPPQIQMQAPYNGYAATQSMNDLSSRHSMLGNDQMLMEPRRMDVGMRTMSMVQPSSSSFLQHPGYAGSMHGGPAMGYTPSIAPSERSNIGLPGRYRPVSHVPSSPTVTGPMDTHRRTNTMSGALGRWEDHKTKPSISVVPKMSDASDDDDEEGWEAMKAKREKKKSAWKSKKSFGSELSALN